MTSPPSIHLGRVALMAAALLLSPAIPAAAAAGELDGSFGRDGRVRTHFGYGDDAAHRVAVPLGGKVVVVGSGETPSGSDFALARYNEDGTLDRTFGGDGRVSTDFGLSDDVAHSIALQPDGKMVVSGEAWTGMDSDFALARYNRDGTLDRSFGRNGRVTADFGQGDDIAHDVALEQDGHIVAGGEAAGGGGTDMAVARFNGDGRPDDGFGLGGKVRTDFAGGDDVAHGIAIQSDGKVVAGGTAGNGRDQDMAAARYNLNGSLDQTFSRDGKAAVDFGSGDDLGFDVAVLADGRIVLAGKALGTRDVDFGLARLKPDGRVDRGFGQEGRVRTDFGFGNDSAGGVAVDGEGRIVAAGSAAQTTGLDFGVARYLSDGALDPSFGNEGRVTTDFRAYGDVARGVAIDSQGRIVAAGSASDGAQFDFAVARYLG